MQNQAGAAESKLYLKLVPKMCGCLCAPVGRTCLGGTFKTIPKITAISGNVTGKGAFYLK